MNDHDFERLSAYLDGELSPDDAASVEEALAQSPEWSDARNALVQADAWLRQGEESPILSIVPHLDAAQETRRTLRRNGTNRDRRGLYLSALVVGLVLAGLALLSGREPNTPPDSAGPGAQAPIVSSGPPASEETATTNDLSADAQAGSIGDAREAQEPALPVDPVSYLSLEGTALGSNPAAVIRNAATGTEKVYRVGQTVIEGITLKEVTSKAAVLERSGEEIPLRAGALELEPPMLKTIDGLWRMILHVAGQEEEYHDLLRFQMDGSKLNVVNGKDDSPFASGSIDERDVMLQFNDNGVVYVMRGTLDIALDSLALHFEGATPYASVDPQDVELRLTRVEDKDLADITELSSLREEVERVRGALIQYAQEHEARFPLKLDALVPDYLETLDTLNGTQNITLDYHGGLPLARIDVPPILRFDDFQVGYAWDYRLKEWDNLLMRSWGGAEWLHPENVLILTCKKPAVVFTLSARGDLHERVERPEYRGPEDISEMAERNAWISRDRANLEELGIAIRMFQNEHEGYTPGGWASAYPAYLKDPSLLSSPKDEPGADSYLYLYPATNLDRLIAERAKDPDIWDTDPDAARQLQAQIPILLNRTDYPGEQPGRNVLFMNWEVEFLFTNSPEWREWVLPHLTQAR
ncbi:MAG: zf-HC2 domain-containing protein [Candidatus Hydrogenedentes bacterium]|nr:zf-HC2 domain-containing protein [Candidatus Hydrogenedentota bacterium]